MKRRHSLQVGAIAVVAILLFLILRHVNVAKLRDALVGVSWVWPAAIVLINILNTWVEAFRWKLIIGSIKRTARTWNAFAAILSGVAGNAVLAFRLGDGLRAFVLSRREHLTLATSLGTVMLDRIADVTFFLAMVLVTGLVFDLPEGLERAGIVGGIVLGVGLIVVFLLVRFGRHIEPKTRGHPGAKIRGHIHRFTIGLSALKHAGILLPVSLLSVFSWMLRLTMVLAIFRGFHLGLPKIAGVVFLIFSNLGIAAISTPANLGGFEIAGLAALRLFGIDTETAVACTLVFHLIEVIPTALLGLAVLMRSGFKSGDFWMRRASQ